MIGLDLVAGLALVAAALALRRSAVLASLAGAAAVLWFAGDITGPLVFAHRGPLTHLLLIYPRVPKVRPRPLQILAIGTAYAAATFYPLGRLELVALVVWILLLAVALAPYRGAIRRGSHRFGAWSAVLLWSVPALRAGLPTIGVDPVLLAAYETVVVGIAAGLVLEDGYSRWRAQSLATLAIDLGERGAQSLNAAVARALRDPSVRIALSGPDDTLVDERGQPVDQPQAGRTVTELRDGERRLGVIEHDPSALLDPVLLNSVTALARIAISNVKLQAEVESRIADVEASRRRLLSVADAERVALARRIDADVLAALERGDAQLRALRDPGELPARLLDARRVVEDFSRGVRHPPILDEQGLAAAVTELVTTFPIPVDVDIPPQRMSAPIEAAAYFVVAEALTNMAKHARAAQATIRVTREDSSLTLVVHDDGIGGANPANGSGLTGLRDRLDVLGGSLDLSSPPGNGTTIAAHLPRHTG